MGQNCSVSLDSVALDRVHNWMDDLGGPSILNFLSDADLNWAQNLFVKVGSPEISTLNVMEILTEMTNLAHFFQENEDAESVDLLI